MHGLVAYDDESHSDSESHYLPSSSKVQMDNGKGKDVMSDLDHEKNSKSDDGRLSERQGTRSTGGAQVVIRRPAHAKVASHLRTRLPDEHGDEWANRDRQVSATTSAMDAVSMDASPGSASEVSDELAQIRALLKPPPIPSVDEWGIPPESEEPCDPVIEAKVAQFLALKSNPEHPTHFNDSLMSNRSFRNPHLYAKLVEFVDVDERTTNFPRDLWDPMDVSVEWCADRIAEQQKARSQQQAQTPSGKRSQIDFTSSSRKDKDPSGGHHQASSGSARKSRFQPYGSGSGGSQHMYGEGRGGLGLGYGRRGKESGRW